MQIGVLATREGKKTRSLYLRQVNRNRVGSYWNFTTDRERGGKNTPPVVYRKVFPTDHWSAVKFEM